MPPLEAGAFALFREMPRIEFSPTRRIYLDAEKKPAH